MNTQINDGGPAFPLSPEVGKAHFDDPMAYPGMTLRDWLAGQALNGLLHSASYGAELKRIFDASESIANAGDERESPQDYTARLALSLADAIIRQRGANTKSSRGAAQP